MTYSVTFELDDDEIGAFLEVVTPHWSDMTITRLVSRHFEEKIFKGVVDPPPARKTASKPRKLRGSKVADAILKALHSGEPVSRADLKQAIVKANLAASSLPGALILMHKEGKIERAGEGLYRLPEHLDQAAE